MQNDANAAADAGGASEAVQPATSTTDAAPSMRDTMLAVVSKHYKERDEGGRFAAKEIATDAAPETAAPVAEETTDQPATQAAETATPSIEPPASWSADVKAKWATLPPDVQTYIAQRESEAHKAITQAGERLKGFEQLDGALGPHRQALRAAYGSEAAAIQQLAALNTYATSDPEGFVRWFIADRRIDPTRLVQAAQSPADPHIATLAQRQAAIEARLNEEQTSRAVAAVEAEIAAFKANAPHFAELEATMTELMPGLLQSNPGMKPQDALKAAYEKAQWLNEGVRAKLLAEQEAARKAAAEAEAAKAVKEAKRAASVNLRSNSPGGSPATPQNMRDTMLAVARRAYAGG